MLSAKRRFVAAVPIAELGSDDDGLQPRAELNARTVREYEQAMRSGDVFPPVLVFKGGNRYWLVDGYHRVAALRAMRSERVVAEVRLGTREDALWASCACNVTHGLRRSNHDKERAVLRALEHPMARRLSDRQIAAHCGVHHHTVGRARKRQHAPADAAQNVCRVVRRGSSVYRQNVSGIQVSNALRSERSAGQTQCGTPKGSQAHPRVDRAEVAAERVPAGQMHPRIEDVRELLTAADAQLSVLLANDERPSSDERRRNEFRQFVHAREQIRRALRAITAVLDADVRGNIEVAYVPNVPHADTEPSTSSVVGLELARIRRNPPDVPMGSVSGRTK